MMVNGDPAGSGEFQLVSTMSSRKRSLNRRYFKEAEGFLELATLFEDRFPLNQQQKAELAELSVQSLNKICEPGTRESRVLYLKGQAYRLAERYDDAIEALERSAELDSSNIHTCLALGWCFKRKGQLGLAVEALQNALAIDRRSGIAHYNTACYFALLKQAKLALIHLASAIDIDVSFRALALDEPDFDPIRNDPEFHTTTARV